MNRRRQVVILLLLVSFGVLALCAQASSLSCDVGANPLLTIGLVADNHYDTFPAGEQAPWEPLDHWLQGQRQRTSTTTKRRYDVAKDKMLETAEVFNLMGDNLTMAVNLGDLVNNDLMWNLKPILDAFNEIKKPHFNILGNHDLRAHNDRFGKINKTQEAWLKHKLGLREWYYSIQYGPFSLIFVDSMVVDEAPNDAKRIAFLQWLDAELAAAERRKKAIIVFGHISVGLRTNAVLGPLLRKSPHIVAAFFGHEHRGGYTKQDHMHTVILQGQIETLVNAFAVLDVFCDRLELTGFGRVPTRVMPMTNSETVGRIRQWVQQDGLSNLRASSWGEVDAAAFSLNIATQGHQPLPPSQLWANERLQQHPPLNLNLPEYRKPPARVTEPNPGNTRFLTAYRSWPRRQRTPAPEDPVDLTSHHKGRRTLFRQNAATTVSAAVFRSVESSRWAADSARTTMQPRLSVPSEEIDGFWNTTTVVMVGLVLLYLAAVLFWQRRRLLKICK